MEEKNKPGETVPEPGESERISAERKAALQDIDLSLIHILHLHSIFQRHRHMVESLKMH